MASSCLFSLVLIMPSNIQITSTDRLVLDAAELRIYFQVLLEL